MTRKQLLSFVASAMFAALQPAWTQAADWLVGFGKTDITPEEPLRLSGYSSRTELHETVVDPLAARAMALSPAEPSTAAGPSTSKAVASQSENSEDETKGDIEAVVLVSVDSILVTSQMTVEIAEWIQQEYAISRSRLAISSTHSHAAPHLSGGLENLFGVPSTEPQREATARYTREVVAAIKTAITQALESRQPANLAIGDSQAQFAVNRRVLKDGIWSGFGVQPDGPVDQRVRVLRVTDKDGQLLGGTFLYACHCTTMGGDFNQVSGDWAGLAAGRLEVIHNNAVFLPVIGCGADANPNPRGTYEMAQKHAAEIVDAVQEVLQSEELRGLSSFPVTHFGYAGLAPEQPTAETMEKMANSERSNEQYWAEHMRRVKREMGRLPETYPMPIHTWQFGDQLTWVFLGGEVVVDYQILIEKEMPTAETWVAAYTDDVFAYVASERMRGEGGYEVDFSMIFYLQPGRWQGGTQSLILRRVSEISKGELTESEPLSADEALDSIRVPEGFRVELVASEPLISDPVNIAFGSDGRVWVVEMADYPRGAEGGGRIKWLRDNDGDGRMDESQLFLEGLEYPTSVIAWKDGVIIIAAPDIFFAADRDGDGRAEHRETLLTGIGRANPQHRASGFEIGLDGWLHFGAGDDTRVLKSLRNGQSYNVRGKDVAWNPESGEIKTTSGHTQFVRARDAFGNWFGNSNSHPIYQYVIEDRYLDGGSVFGGVRAELMDPPVAPPVLPRSKTIDRFNDLFALNRFTSACSSIISRVPGVSPPEASRMREGGLEHGRMIGFVCEPVHNLVSRIEILPDGATFSATRHPDDQEYDFFTSTDPWSRPVRVVNGPDGSLWILDMVRRVIEHPEWIPTSWQQRLDLRAGSQLGRIYRVYRNDFEPLSLPNWTPATKSELLTGLSSPVGPLRDLALERIMHTTELELQADLQRLVTAHPLASVRVAALGCLAATGWLTAEEVAMALLDQDPRVVGYALQMAESFSSLGESLTGALDAVPSRALGPAIDLQWILTSTRLPSYSGSAGLQQIAGRGVNDHWITKALSLVKDPDDAFAVARGMLTRWQPIDQLSPTQFARTVACVSPLWQRSPRAERRMMVESRFLELLEKTDASLSNGDLLLMTVLGRSKSGATDIDEKLTDQVMGLARGRMLSRATPLTERLVLVNLIGSDLGTEEDDLRDARVLLQSKEPLQLQQAVIESLRHLDSESVAELLLESWDQLNGPQRNSACATLLSRREWTDNLVVALEEGLIQPRQLDPATIQRLRSYGDRNLRSRCMKVFGKPSPRSQVVTHYLQEVPPPQVTAASPKLFAEHCAACHQAKEGQSMIGPPLENLKHWTIDQWLSAILDPNATVEPKYLQSQVLTTDDQVLSGILIRRDANQVTLALGDGTIRKISRSEIAAIKQTQISLMPEGFEEKMSPEQVSELLGYLRQR